ncbi:uncharacterized protein LOC143249103 isoform X3 [Tachypleus tridentatus]
MSPEWFFPVILIFEKASMFFPSKISVREPHLLTPPMGIKPLISALQIHKLTAIPMEDKNQVGNELFGQNFQWSSYCDNSEHPPLC